MKNLIINLKKSSKLRFMFYTVFLIYLVSFILITKGLLLLSGIETLLRYIVIFVFFVFLVIYLITSLVFIILKKHRHLIVTTIIIIIFSIVNVTVYYYINKTFGYIDVISKDTVLYTTNLISLTNTTEIKKVGMISEESDIEGNVLPKEYLAKNKNNYEIVMYDDYLELLNDLYEKEVDGIFITSNYVLLYNYIEKFLNIKSDTKIIDKYSAQKKNNDMVKGSNKSVTEPFTALIIGVDSQHDGLTQNAAFNGDALMLISFNPKTLSATVFSIPRDTYVPIACNNNKNNKINSAAAYGSKCILETIQNLTGIDIDYYMKINFKGLVALVDALGGIEVDVPKPDFPSKYCLEDSNRVSQNICLTPGFQKLDGEHALALARVRSAFLISDFQRVLNQQLVIEAMLQKTKQIRNINDFYNVLNAISRNLDTNMSTKEMLNFYNVGKPILLNNSFINIEKTFLTGYDLTVNMGGMGVYTFQYYKESLADIVKAMKVTLELEKPEIIKTFNFSMKNPYEIEVIGKKHSTGERRETLPSFVDKDINYLENWAKSKNITVNKTYNESNICINNEILTQSVGVGTLLSTVNSITVSVCKNVFTNETPADKPKPPSVNKPEDNSDEDDLLDQILGID